MSVLLRLSTVFLLALSVFLGAVSARPQFGHIHAVKKREASELYTTNAARMAAGLPPMMPRNLFNPSRVKVARQQPSATPVSGRIKVTQNGNIVGYVKKSYDSSGRLIVDTNLNSAGSDLTVTFTNPATTTALFNIQITSSGGASQPNVGFAHNSVTLGVGTDFTTLTGTNPTTAGGIAAQVGNGMSSPNTYSESPIWSYDASTKVLSNTWLNPSSQGSSTGTAVSVFTYYKASTGEIVQSRSSSLAGYVKVVLTVVP